MTDQSHNRVQPDTAQPRLSPEMVLQEARPLVVHLNSLDKPYSAGVVTDCIATIENLQSQIDWLRSNPSPNAVTGSSGTHPVPEGAADNAPPAIKPDMCEVLDFLNSIEGAGYGGMASFEIARQHVREAVQRYGVQSDAVRDAAVAVVAAVRRTEDHTEWFEPLANLMTALSLSSADQS